MVKQPMNQQPQAPTIHVHDRHHGWITISYEVVTPEMATQWLSEHNNKNRRMNDRHNAMIVRQILGGKWMLTTDAIGFDWDGDLVNGQHRLHGVVTTGHPQPFLVVRGLDPDVFNVIDGGRKREASDLLDRIGGYVSTTALGSALRAVIYYRERGHFANPNFNLSNAEIISHLENEPGIEYAVERSKALRRAGLKSTPPAIVAALYHIFNECSPDDVDPFMEKWATGIGIVKSDDPLHALRRRLDDPAIRSRNDKAALAIYTWNKYRRNEPLSRMRIPDEFPKPI